MDYLSIFKDFCEEQQKVNSQDSKVLIIDGLNRFISVWSAVPVINDTGYHVGGVAGFLKSVGYMIRYTDCTRCVIVFDGKGGALRRRKLYPDYKKKRTPTTLKRTDFINAEDELYSMRSQLNRILEYLTHLPITVIQAEYIEADDAIANIVTSYYEGKDNSIVIASTDKDFLQLVSNRISVFNPIKKKIYTPESLAEEYGLLPENFLTYKIMMGDTSDNIPGVNGVGTKTLIKEFNLDKEIVSIEKIVEIAKENAEKKGSKKFYSHIVGGQDKIELNYSLMQLSDANISLTSKNAIRDAMNQKTNLSNRLEIKKMVYADQITPSFSDLDKWLETFSKLDYWAK
jgi:DNA polymerase-1